MVIDWSIFACFVIAAFTIGGFSRGWWKEAVTTVVLAFFVFLLQRPELATTLVSLLNSVLELVWTNIPTSVDAVQSVDGGGTVVAVTNTSDPVPLIADPTNPGTWMTLLATGIGGAILLSRVMLVSNPAGLLGQILGAGVGLFNGFLTLGLIREYLDGRALPGQSGTVSAESNIILGGSNGYTMAAQNATIEAVGLPTSITLLDSIFPWLAIIIGLMLFITVVQTKIKFINDKQKGMKVDVRNKPPFYQ